MLPVGLSSCGKKIDNDLFKSYSDSGITHMEISVSAEEYHSINYKEIFASAQKYGIVLWSFHLPFLPFFKIDISKKKLQKYSIDYLSELIKKASDFGIDKFVIHPSGEPILNNERDARMECAKESLFKLSEIAAGCESVIAVENLPRTCLGRDSNDILELIDAHKNLRVCFDTNHLLSEDISVFINKVRDKIVTTHISDYDFLDEKHWLPGEGKVNWNMLYKELIGIGYNGPWLYEVGFVCPKTIKRPRDLTCADFYRNADEIFNCKTLTVINNTHTHKKLILFK